VSAKLCNNSDYRVKRKYEKITEKEQKLLELNDISKERFYGRLTSGWTRKDALMKPVIKHQRITKEERRLMAENGIDSHTFRSRVSRNMDRIEAATKPKRKYKSKV